MVRTHCPAKIVFTAVLLVAVFALTSGVPTADATTIPASITTNTTLTAAKSPYTGTSVKVKSGVTLTINPGVKVKLTGTLEVAGTLSAEGTVVSPIILTSQPDSGPNQWTGIVFAKTSGSSVMTHVNERFATTGLQVLSSSPSVVESTFTQNGEGGIRVSAGSPHFEKDTIAENGSVGLSPGVVFAGSEKSSSSVDFTHNTVDGNNGDGVYLGGVFYLVSASLGHNTITGNAGKAINYAVESPLTHPNPIPPDISSNALEGNAQDGIWLEGDVQQSTTWEDHGYAMVINDGSVTVSKGATLTLAPGVVVKNPEFRVGIEGKGNLKAEGTVANPVLLTALSDDSANGDTNGDGSETAPEPGLWNAIVAGAGGGIDLKHTIVSYGGFSSFGGAFAAILGECPCAGGIDISESVIRRSSSRALVLNGSEASVTDSTFTENGAGAIRVEGGSSVFREDTISDNCGTFTGAAVDFAGSEESPSSIDFTYNTVDGNGCDGIYAGGGFDLVSASLGHNTVTDNADKAIDYAVESPLTHPNPIPPDLTTNVVEGNGQNGIWLQGEVEQSMTWEDHDYAMVINDGSVTVAEGVTLTLNPGVVVKGSQARGLLVKGHLTAHGAKGNPIVFTAETDDTVDGDTNGDGMSTSPEPGYWYGVYLAHDNDVEPFKYTAFKYAAAAVNIGFLTGILEISHAEWVDNEAAIEAVPPPTPECVPPWWIYVLVEDSWFDPFPGVSLPKYELEFGANTIPYKTYTCNEPKEGPTPVTPVVIVSPLEDPLNH